MASEQTVQAFNEMKELYMSTMAPELLVEARQNLSPRQSRVMDVEPTGGDGDIDAKDLSKLRKFRDRLGKGEHNSEESAANVERNYKAIAGVKESYSNWREENPDLFEAVQEDENNKEIDVDKSINNYKKGINGKPAVQINPDALKESFSDYDVELISSEELDESYLVEAAEIATEYLYECGLNEYGVEELIESLGEDKFIDFVFDLAEDYELNEENLLEWRRGPDGTKIRGDQTTKSGKHFKDVKGGAKKTAARATSEAKARKAEKEAEPTGSKVGSELSKLSDRSKQLRKTSVDSKASAIAQKPETSATPAKETETKKQMSKGILGRLADRAKQDIGLLQTSVNTARNVAARRAAEVKAGYDAVRERGRKAEASPEAAEARKKIGAAAQTAGKVAGKVAKAAAGAAGAGAGHLVKGHSLARAAGGAAGTLVKKLRTEEVELQEKSESQSQQQLFGLALSVKRGETPRSKASQEVLDIVDSMSEGKIRDFAKTKHKGLPQHVKEETHLIDKVLKIVRDSK